MFSSQVRSWRAGRRGEPAWTRVRLGQVASRSSYSRWRALTPLAGRAGEHDVLRALQDCVERGRLRAAQAEQLDGDTDEVVLRRLVEGQIQGQVVGVTGSHRSRPSISTGGKAGVMAVLARMCSGPICSRVLSKSTSSPLSKSTQPMVNRTSARFSRSKSTSRSSVFPSGEWSKSATSFGTHGNADQRPG